MKSPVCEFCGKDFRDTMDQGGMVQFRPTYEDEEELEN